MKKYLVTYIRNDEERTYRVSAMSKQEAYNKFRAASKGRYKVASIEKYTPLYVSALVSVVVTAALFLVVSCLIIATCKTYEPVDYVEYIVKPGDTLWEIARGSDMWNKIDASIIIEDMCERSNCTATIHPGQIVYIPIYGE